MSAALGYRAALSEVFHLRGLDLSSSPELAALVRQFKVSVPATCLKLPPWDLNIVLHALRSPPYEPLEDATPRHLLIKTLFLLSFMSARGVSELQALSYDVGFGFSSSVCFQYAPDFVAKTELVGASARQFVVPALSSLVGSDDEELLLCPVRALRCYLRLTSPSRPGVQRLFMSLRSPERARSKNAVVHFLRYAVLDAHVAVPEDVMRLTKVKAHEVRALSSSLLFRKNRSIRDIQEAAIWCCNTTFVSFYLHDVSHNYLGPMVTSGRVV